MSDNNINNRPVLNSIRILDFTWVLAGPYATRLLADFGAEVIKVQPPLSPEEDDAFAREYYRTWNRNKLGITLDLNRHGGVDLVKRLVRTCDVMVENFTPRVMANFGLDYENLKKVKPDIIMVSLSVMGQTGPWRDFTGFGATVHAFSGLTGLTRFPGGPPLGPGFSYADHVAGLYASLALLGALEHRRRTGEGQHVDISQVEAAASLLGGVFGGEEPIEGNGSAAAAPHNVYRCADGRWCAVSVFDDGDWRALKEALGGTAWAGDGRFDTTEARLKNREELDRLMAEWMGGHSAAEAVSVLQSRGVAAGVVQDAADLAVDPQLAARGFFVEAGDHGVTDASPIKLSRTPAQYRRAAPWPGRDNDYVFRRLLGLDKSEIKELVAKDVILQP